MNRQERVRMGDAFVALLEGDPTDATELIAKIRPEVIRDGQHKDAIRGLLALLDERAAEHG